MQFRAPVQDRLPADWLSRAYLAGMELIPWNSSISESDDLITLERDVAESGNLYVPWKVNGLGEVVLSTTSLMEREEPYHLTIELARGTVNRLRNQMCKWEAAGMAISAELRERVRTATEKFVRAATAQHDPQEAHRLADAAIAEALYCLEHLGGDYARQVFEVRHQQHPKLSTLLAAGLPENPLALPVEQAFLETFNAASPPFVWRRLEPSDGEFDWESSDRAVAWCHQHGLRVCSGPLVRLDRSSLPDWIYLWEEEYDSLQRYVQKFVTEVVKRYRGKVHVWQCAAGLNVPGALGLSEEQKLRLTVAALDAVRRADPKAPVIVTFDRPWAEFFATETLDLAPMNFADLLVRADLGMAGVGLEINFGYWPGGTLLRDSVEVSRQIDDWAARLGLPIIVFLTIPGGSGEDALAAGKAQPLPGPGDASDADSQARLAQRLLPILLSKTSVHGVVWSQLLDGQQHLYCHGGLFDAAGAAKPALSLLRQLRQEHLS